MQALRFSRIILGGPRRRQWGASLDYLLATGLANSWRRFRSARDLSGSIASSRDSLYDRIWREAAAELDADVTELEKGSFLIEAHGRKVHVRRQVTELDSPAALERALDKPLVHRLLEEDGLTVPHYRSFDAHDPEPALEFLATGAGPFVIKPAVGTGGGAGVTTGIRTPSQLVRAVLFGARSDPGMLIEEEVPGTMYRALILDGELVDVYGKRPPSVEGDGTSTVLQLIEKENMRRAQLEGAAGSSVLTPTLDSIFTLDRTGKTLGSVPKPGELVSVKTVINQSAPKDCFTHRERLAPEILDAAVRASALVGLRLAGIDFVTTDPSLPFSQTGGAILEVNGTPGLHHHYQVAHASRATRVAVPVLRAALAHP